MSAREFMDRVYISRDAHAGGEFHRRLLWSKAISSAQVQGSLSFLPGNWALNDIVQLVLDYGEDSPVPSENSWVEALQDMYARKLAHEGHLRRRAERLRLSGDSLKKFESSVCQERLAVQERAREVRARQRTETTKILEEHQKIVDRTCRELSRLDAMRPRFMIAVQRALLQARYDDGVPRSREAFDAGASGLVDFVRKMLEVETTSLAEYTMAHWKIICDKAMSKWRPYEKKSAAALGLSEIRYKASGSSIYRREDKTPKASFSPHCCGRQWLPRYSHMSQSYKCMSRVGCYCFHI